MMAAAAGALSGNASAGALLDAGPVAGRLPDGRQPGPVASAAVVALDVGASRIKAALVAPDGSRLAELQHPTGRADGPAAVLRRVTDVAAHLAAAHAGTEILACGIAVCGTVGPDGLVTSVNLGWEQEPVGRAVSSRLGMPVAVLNDAHAGAIGEGNAGAARGVGDYLYVSLGTGIGAAIVKDGRVLSGAHGHAGELGHISVDRRGRLCACGSRGCLETFMSAAALEARWLEVHGSPLPARQIIDQVIDRDPAATALWDESIEALASGLLTVMSLIDPATIVLGGGLSGAGSRLIEPLAAGLRAGAQPFHAGAELRLAALGDWSGCAGAATAARTRIT
jgi:glucokinase